MSVAAGTVALVAVWILLVLRFLAVHRPDKSMTEIIRESR